MFFIWNYYFRNECSFTQRNAFNLGSFEMRTIIWLKKRKQTLNDPTQLYGFFRKRYQLWILLNFQSCIVHFHQFIHIFHFTSSLVHLAKSKIGCGPKINSFWNWSGKNTSDSRSISKENYDFLRQKCIVKATRSFKIHNDLFFFFFSLSED